MDIIARKRLLERTKNKLLAKKRFNTDFDRYIQFFNQVHVYELMEWNSKTSPQPELRFSFWRRIYNMSVFIYMWFNLFRFIALLFITEKPWTIYLADFTEFVDANRYLTLAFNINVAISGIMTLSLFYVYQFIDPVNTSFWLKPLAVMDGRLSPQSIGLDYETGKKLMKRERFANLIFLMSCPSGIGCGFFGMIIPYAIFYSLGDFIKFGILASISFAIFLFYIQGSLVTAFLYLHLICYACYHKFKAINNDIKQLISLMNNPKLSKSTVKLVQLIINKHNEACSSLAEFNKFWRLVIFIIYQGYQPMFCIMLLQAVMIDSGKGYAMLLIKTCMAFGATYSLSIIEVFALSAEMVSTEAFSVYPKLGTLMAATSGKLDIKERLKLQNLMMRVSTEKIGFTCYDLFVVDRRAVYELMSGLFVFFMLLLPIAMENL